MTMTKLLTAALGLFMGKIFLVIVDSYSKRVEVFPVSNSTSWTTINCLRICFTTHWLPKFVSRIMDRVLQANNVNVLCKKTAFCISNQSPIIQLQMDAQKDLLELLKTLLEKRKGQVV